MSVQKKTISSQESDQRLDRWFKVAYPNLPFGRLQKLLRTGQVRVNGKRVKSAQILNAGDEVRIPPLDHLLVDMKTKAPQQALTPAEIKDIQSWVIYKDAHIIAINKPAGLAVQGGTGTKKHVDRLLDGLKFDKIERPKLAHRLDKDTSGVLVLARDRQTAKFLMHAFQQHEVEKTYWAVVVGVPKPHAGTIDLKLSKLPTKEGEKVQPDENGQKAITDYKVIDRAQTYAWVAMNPRTGRTHQLRAHMQAMETPILGDGKYGGHNAHAPELSSQLHLCAKTVTLPTPSGKMRTLSAPLPAHMKQTFTYFGFEECDDQACSVRF